MIETIFLIFLSVFDSILAYQSTSDFKGHLMSRGEWIQVISPEWLAEDMQQWLKAAMSRYYKAEKQENL